ncbi:MAG: class I SAM-dependent methyltransferase [bacterium]|nr:class I SAM-dependent methyltransferase [bacterium]
MTRSFSCEPLAEIIGHIRSGLTTGRAVIRVPNPDAGHGRYPGEPASEHPGAARHRPLRVWTDLADRLELRLHTPVPLGDMIELCFTQLDPDAELLDRGVRGPGKYTPGSGFHRASKLEEPDFLIDFDDALHRCVLPEAPRVLSLGVNTGDELRPLLEHRPKSVITGIDHDERALDVARSRFPSPHAFVCADLGDLPELPRFDLLLCIDTLQSPGVDDRAVLRHAIQELLVPTASLILGVPNCRYVDGELLHGARMVNFRQPELSLLLKGVAFYKKYLQQHGKRVFVTGKHELLVTAAAIGLR